MYIPISAKVAKKVFVFLLIIVLCLVLVSFVAVNRDLLPEPLSKLFLFLEQQYEDGTIAIPDVNSEVSIADRFSSSILLCCSILLISIASFKSVTRDRYAILWTILALIFLCMYSPPLRLSTLGELWVWK